MNWKEIFEKCPKSRNKLINWVGFPLGVDSVRGNLWYGNDPQFLFPMRNLYDFFDEQGIYGWVNPEIQYTRTIDEDDKNPHYCIDEWGYDIHDDSFELAIDYGFKSRAEAEEIMLEKEFEILEEKLNN